MYHKLRQFSAILPSDLCFIIQYCDHHPSSLTVKDVTESKSDGFHQYFRNAKSDGIKNAFTMEMDSKNKK